MTDAALADWHSFTFAAYYYDMTNYYYAYLQYNSAINVTNKYQFNDAANTVTDCTFEALTPTALEIGQREWKHLKFVIDFENAKWVSAKVNGQVITNVPDVSLYSTTSAQTEPYLRVILVWNVDADNSAHDCYVDMVKVEEVTS